MIESIGIKNYKSIVDLQFDVGRVNVFIGENGSGKSNILEAIALAAAAEADKLDNEFLISRGIRVTSSDLMFSSFESKKQIHLNITFQNPHGEREYKIKRTEEAYSKLYRDDSRNNKVEKALENLEEYREISPKEIPAYIDEIASFIKDTIATENSLGKNKFRRFIVYSPEESALRNLYRKSQIEPLGMHGEGLLKLVKVLNKESAISVRLLKESLISMGWFEDINISNPTTIALEEEHIKVLDKFTQSWFDQRSANEGFLFVLFYVSLIVSKDTPSIFAIDNVDASLNPKLCTKIVSDIVKLAKQFDKQCFLTAHNPAILDGIDLGDDEQRLFVVSRNRKGHTRVKRIGIESKPVSSTGEELKLSEAFLRGYLGGLPKNF